MKFRTPTPRTRRDCVLDARLSPEQASRFAHRLDCGMPHRDAVDWLWEQCGVRLSTSAVSRWAAKRRQAKSAETFARCAEQEIAGVSTEPGAIEQAVRTHAIALNRIVQVAGLRSDPRTMMMAAKSLGTLLAAAAKSHRADTHRMRAELARAKFEGRVIRAALDHAAELGRISADSQVDRSEQVARVAACLFGGAARSRVEATRKSTVAPLPPVDSGRQSPLPERQGMTSHP